MLDRQILRVAVPAFFALVSEPLMLLADTAIIGHLGTQQLAGLSAAAVVLGSVAGLCVFLAYGSTASVARRHGAGDEAGAHAVAVGGLWLAGVLGIALGAVIALGSAPLARAIGSSPAVDEYARQYLLVSTLSIPALLLVLAATGALRGDLDLRTPLIVAIAANVLNVLLNVLLVYGFDFGVRGAAAGTVIAQWAAALWLGAVVLRRARRSGAPTGPRWGEIGRAALDGVPLIVRTATLRVSLILATVVAAGMGDVQLAAHQIAGALVILLAFALDAIAIAGQTLTGRALGAGDVVQVRALTRRMIWWGLGTGLLGGGVVAASAPWLPHLFTGDDAVRDTLVPALLVIAALQPISGVVFVLDGVLIGAGDGAYLAIAGLIVLAVYAPPVLLVGWLEAGFTWLWIAYGGFLAARLATLWHRQRGDAWFHLA